LFFPFQLLSDDAAAVENGVVQPLRDRTLRDVSEGLPLPAGLRERFAGGDGELPVWQEVSPGARDLHPQVRAILGVGGEGAPLPPHLGPEDVKRFVSHPPQELTKAARNVVSGAWGKRGSGMEVQLRKAAVRRLGLVEPAQEDRGTKKAKQPPVWLPVRVENATVWLCGTGVGIVVVELSFTTVEGKGRLGTAGIIEGNYACYRTGSQAEPMRWRQAAGKGGAGDGLWRCVTRDAGGQDPGETLTLEGIVSALVPLAGDPNTAEDGGAGAVQGVAIHWERLFTYTAVQLAEPLASERERIELAYRLSRKITDAYLPSDERLREGVVGAFDNILHASALEGGAVVVEETLVEGKEVDFFKNFIAKAVRPTYFYLAILGAQEYCKLLRMVESTALPVSLKSAGPKDLDYLDRVRRCLLEFQLNYRFSQASLLTIHNRVYEEWRRVLGLDRMLAELREDVSQVTSYLDYRLQKDYETLQRDYETLQKSREVKRNQLGRTQTVLGIIIGAAIGLTGVFGMNIRGFQDVPWDSPFALTWIGGLGGGAVVLAAGYYWWSSRIEKR